MLGTLQPVGTGMDSRWEAQASVSFEDLFLTERVNASELSAIVVFLLASCPFWRLSAQANEETVAYASAWQEVDATEMLFADRVPPEVSKAIYDWLSSQEPRRLVSRLLREIPETPSWIVVW